MGNITDGELGVMTYCDGCRKELLQHINKYEDLPKGWVVIGTDLLCPYCSTRVTKPHDGELKTLHALLGATLELTEDQYNDIMNAKNDQGTAFKAFKLLLTPDLLRLMVIAIFLERMTKRLQNFIFDRRLLC